MRQRIICIEFFHPCQFRQRTIGPLHPVIDDRQIKARARIARLDQIGAKQQFQRSVGVTLL